VIIALYKSTFTMPYRTIVLGWLKYSKMGGSVAEWLAYWTQAQKGPGSNRSRDAVE